MNDVRGNTVPGFWRVCFVDAYLFKIAYLFTPLLCLVVAYNMVTGRAADDFILPLVFLGALACVVYFRWSAIIAAFKDHAIISCGIAGIAPGGGLLGMHVLVSFYVSCDGQSVDRFCCLTKFNQWVKKLHEGDIVTVFWNESRNIYVIKEAYLDD